MAVPTSGVDENATADLTVTANFVEAISLEYFAGPNGTLTGTTSQMVAFERAVKPESTPCRNPDLFSWTGAMAAPIIHRSARQYVVANVSVTANFGPQ